jgi:ADP-ribosylglycohydrolase
MTINQDRIRGCLLGLAAGDRIGGPIQMALTLGESLAARQGFDPEDIGQRYLAWWRESGFDTGPTAAGVFRLVDNGKSFPEAVRIIDHELEGMTAGCNPMHRCPPLALSPYIQDEDLTRDSTEEARLTHYHPTAGEGSGLVTTLIRNLIRGKSWKEAIMLSARGQPDWILTMIFSKIPPNSQGGYTPDVLKAALYFLHTSENFQDALEGSLAFAGPPNYCPVLVGALAGARWGAGSILPTFYKHNNKYLEWITNLVDQFSTQWEECHV